MRLYQINITFFRLFLLLSFPVLLTHLTPSPVFAQEVNKATNKNQAERLSRAGSYHLAREKI